MKVALRTRLLQYRECGLAGGDPKASGSIVKIPNVE